MFPAVRSCLRGLACLLALAAPAAMATDLALVGAKVYPAPDAAPLDDATVLVHDGRVTRIGPRGGVAVPAGARVVDARGQVALASGRPEARADTLTVRAERGGPGYGVCSTDFLEWAFRTDSYQLDVTFHEDGTWSYVSDTVLQVRGRPEPFHHIDRNRLAKVAEPEPNPLLRITRDRVAKAAAHGIG